MSKFSKLMTVNHPKDVVFMQQKEKCVALATQ